MARPNQIGETVPSKKGIEAKKNESDEAELAACLKEVLKEKCRFEDDEDKPVLPHKETMAEKKSKTQPIVPPKKGEESSLASELWQLKRKCS